MSHLVIMPSDEIEKIKEEVARANQIATENNEMLVHLMKNFDLYSVSNEIRVGERIDKNSIGADKTFNAIIEEFDLKSRYSEVLIGQLYKLWHEYFTNGSREDAKKTVLDTIRYIATGKETEKEAIRFVKSTSRLLRSFFC